MHILTFDVEEWFHILDNASTKEEAQWDKYERRLDANMARIFDLLESRGQKATFFCLGWVARHFPHIIREIHDRGFQIATHSDRHQLAFEQTPEEFRSDLEQSIKCLEDTAGVRIRAYRAPGFSVKEDNIWVFEELIAAGIEVDCSVFPAAHAHGGFKAFGKETPTLINTPSGTLKEFPINTHRIFGKPFIFSGGGYFRLLPGSLICRFSQQSDYVMTYFHPRDFDPDQPMIPDLSFYRKFKSYYGLRGARAKLEMLLDGQQFISLEAAENSLDWTRVPQVNLIQGHLEKSLSPGLFG